MRKTVVLGGSFIFLSALKMLLLTNSLGLSGGYPVSVFLIHLFLQAGVFFTLYSFSFRKRILLFWGIQTLCYAVLLGFYGVYHRLFNIFIDFRIIGDGLNVMSKGVVPLTVPMLFLLIDLPALFSFITLVPKSEKDGIRESRKIGIFTMSGTLLLFIWASLFSVWDIPPLSSGSGWGGFSHSIRKVLPELPGKAEDEIFLAEAELKSESESESESEVQVPKIREDLREEGPFSSYIPKAELTGEPNFLVIQFESLQSGLPELFHNGEAVMPFLNRMRSESYYFPYCFAYHRSGGSSDCEIAVLDNIDPGDRALMRSSRYPHDESFIKVLKNRDYSVFGFHDYDKEFYNRESSYKRLGFDGFFDYYDMNMGPPKWAARDGEMFDFILDQTPESFPVLSYVITISSHVGYEHITTYYENPLFDDVNRKRDRHAMLCFNYTDRELERFITKIREKYKNLYILIYGDHSTPSVVFNNELSPSFLDRDGQILEFVPLFIIPPLEIPYEGRVFKDTLASFHDVGPTILELAGVKTFHQGERLASTAVTDADETLSEYLAFGGSLFSDEVDKLPIPFDDQLLDRSELLSLIKEKVPFSD
ncbi:MAG: LTA synthase family protein [Spirochaetales bacterium]|nr:LTA synthase family protein [Spirochaetales bacterium]